MASSANTSISTPLMSEALLPVAQLPHPGFERLLVVAVLQDERPLLQGAGNPDAHFVEQHRLGDVVERADLEAFDGGGHVGDRR